MIVIHFLLSFLFHSCTNSFSKLLLMGWFILWFGSKEKYQCLIKTKTCIMGMYAQSFIRVWFFLTPRTASCQAPLTTTFSRKAYWGGLPFPTPDLPDPGIEPVPFQCSVSSTADGVFTCWATREAPTMCVNHFQNRVTDTHHPNHCLNGKWTSSSNLTC